MISLEKDNLLKKVLGGDVCLNLTSNIGSVVSQNHKGNTSDEDLWVITMNEEWSEKNINLKSE